MAVSVSYITEFSHSLEAELSRDIITTVRISLYYVWYWNATDLFYISHLISFNISSKYVGWLFTAGQGFYIWYQNVFVTNLDFNIYVYIHILKYPNEASRCLVMIMLGHSWKICSVLSLLADFYQQI